MKRQKRTVLGIVLLLVLFLLFGCKGDKQFEKDNTQYGENVEQTADGNALIAGTSDHNRDNYFDFYILKTDSVGSIVWEKSFGGENSDWAKDCETTADGNYVVAGDTESFARDNGEEGNKKNAWIMKLDQDGNKIWSKVYGGPQTDGAQDIEQTSDGGYIVVGHTHTHGDMGIRVWKLASSGELQWTETYSQGLVGQAIEQTEDGGYIIAGGSQPDQSSGELVVIKANSTGEMMWHQKMGDSEKDETALDVKQTLDNGFIVAGVIKEDYTKGYRQDADAWFVKLGREGNISWSKSFGGDKYDTPEAIEQTRNGSYVFAGETHSYSDDTSSDWGTSDQWVGKLDNSGNKMWFKNYGDSKSNSLSDLELLDNGDILAAGTDALNISLLRLGPDGEKE